MCTMHAESFIGKKKLAVYPFESQIVLNLQFFMCRISAKLGYIMNNSVISSIEF